MPRQEIHKGVTDLLELVGLPEQIESILHNYPVVNSNRWLSRAGYFPGLLLLDEPLGALDARVRSSLRLEIRAFHQNLGITTILVTHDQRKHSQWQPYLVMDQGRIEQVGTPIEIYSNPASPFVADFIGVMNFIHGEVTSWKRVLERKPEM